MFFLVKQVSKSSATLEQTQEPGPKSSLCQLSQQETAENDLVTHTHLNPINLLMRKSEKVDLSVISNQKEPTPWADSLGDSCYQPLLQQRSAAPLLTPTPKNKR